MALEEVKYKFGADNKIQIDIVPIAKRLLTNRSKIHTTNPHRTNFYRIIWFQEGNPTHFVDFEKIDIQSPSLLFINKDRIHKFDKDINHDGKVLIFTDDFIFRTEQDQTFIQNSHIFNSLEQPFLLNVVDEKLEILFNAIETELENKYQPFKKETLYHLLNSILYTAERFANSKFQTSQYLSANASLVNSFLKMLEQHYKQRFTIEKYAELLNITTSKLNIIIQNAKGKTGKQVVTERILLEAKRLLVHSEMTVKEIGFYLGFDEPTNFVKFFQTNAKQTPTSFQKANL